MARTAVAQKQNLIKSSNDITAASWATDATSTVAQVSIVDPTGATSSCGRLTCAGGGLQYVRGTGYNPAVGVGSFTFSAWAKTVAGGSQTMRLKANTTAAAYSSNITVTGTWTRVSYTTTDCTGTGTCLIANGSATGALDVYLYGIQIVKANWMGPLAITTGTAVDTGNLRNVSSARTAVAQSQNLFTYSDDLSNAVYTITGITVPIDATVADPFGGFGSTAMTEDATLAVHRVTSRTPLFTAAEVGQTVSIAVWAKKGTETVIVNSIAGLAVGTYDLNAGTASAGTGLAVADIVSVANGFYKCTNTFVVTAAMVGFGFQVAIRQAGAYQGTLGNKAIYIMGFQKTYANWSGPRALTTTTAINTGNIRNVVAQKQNIFANSQELNTAFSTVGASITTNTTDTLDPWGTNTADILVEDGSTGTHRVQNLGGTVSAVGLVQTLSIYVKAGVRSVAYIQNSASESITVNLSTGATTASVGGIARGTESVGNDWWRIWITFASTSNSASVYVYAGDPALSYTGTNGTKALYITGAQYVNANWKGPYARTTATLVNTGNIRNIA